MVEIGDVVIFIDEDRVERPALVIHTFHAGETEPSVNLVVVEKDPARHDSYGRQVARPTSIVHESNQPAGGFCYRTM